MPVCMMMERYKGITRIQELDQPDRARPASGNVIVMVGAADLAHARQRRNGGVLLGTTR